MEDNSKNKFGKLLTDLRVKKNMTQKELAEQLLFLGGRMVEVFLIWIWFMRLLNSLNYQ